MAAVTGGHECEEIPLPPMAMVEKLEDPVEQSLLGCRAAPRAGRSGLLYVETYSDSFDTLSRQTSTESEVGSSTSGLPLQEPGEGSRLPRRLPFVGFLRHAPPQQGLSSQLDRLLRCIATLQQPNDAEKESLQVDDGECPVDDAKLDKLVQPPVLPRTSPYVGFRRHAPPSPSLCFTAPCMALPMLGKLPEAAVDGGHVFCTAKEEMEADRQWLGELPEEVWTAVLSFSAEVPNLAALSSLRRGFPELLSSPAPWTHRPVRVSPTVVPQLAPRLGKWLQVWKACSKLVLPRSWQLIAEVSRRAPELPVEVAWRFDEHLKGDGVEVLRNGLTARRTSDEELVVLGDAALPIVKGRAPYLEVRLDERGEAIGDGLNDFGFGVTACDPEEIIELGSVADEVPRSWVVDFTGASVVLSVNNHEAAKGHCVTSDDLEQGDRVGLRLLPGVMEVYINGELREQLGLASEDCVPIGSRLFPVIDLYGRTVQVSRMEADEPLSWSPADLPLGVAPPDCV